MAATNNTHHIMYNVLAVVYFLLAVAMYYFHEESIGIGIHFMYKFVLAAAIVFLSFVVALIHTNLYRIRIVCRYIFILLLPHIVALVSSMPLWAFSLHDMDVIRKGFFDEIYAIISILSMAGFVYVFGERSLWLNLSAMIAANLVTIVGMIIDGGIATYLSELWTLITTFAGEVGPLIQRAEIHELTFALGIYIVFYIINWKKVKKNRMGRILFIPTLFCFLSGFKRIGIAAVAAAVIVYAVLKMLTQKSKKNYWIIFMSFVSTGLAFAYICLIKAGIYEYLTTRFGIDTMGRLDLSIMIDRYYWIGPDYIGNGIGFIKEMFNELANRGFTIYALHCDILKIYIELGFWGFWLWMLCYFPIRTCKVSRWQGKRGGITCLCCCIYVLATAAADNTFYIVYVTGTLAIIIMSFHLDEQEKKLRKQRRTHLS